MALIFLGGQSASQYNIEQPCDAKREKASTKLCRKKAFYTYDTRICFLIKNDKKYHSDWTHGPSSKKFASDRDSRKHNKNKYG